MKTATRIGVALLGATILATTLVACSAPGAKDAPRPSASPDRQAALQDVWLCMIATDQANTPNVFFGNDMYPGTFRRGDGSQGKGAAQVLVNSWLCSSSAESGTSDKWLPGGMDSSATITWPNGRTSSIGVKNPLIGVPTFYPTLQCSSSGPDCKGETSYPLEEGLTYRCSLVGYDFDIARVADADGHKQIEMTLGGETQITDDFDSPICSKK